MKPEPSEDALKILETVYEWYDEVAWSFRDWACRPECSACCTSSVILTSVEAAYVWARNSVLLKDRLRMWVTVDAQPALQMTANEQALLCISRQDFEDDTAPSTGMVCPLLEERVCACYESRPLMCRMMFSSSPCEETGHAEMPSVLLSLNIACMQLIEHIDKDGLSGYLVHMLPYIGDRNLAGVYEERAAGTADPRMRPNRANPGFLIPPEDRAQIGTWLQELHERQNQRR